MVLNIWLLICSAVLLLAVFIITLKKRPRLPLMTLAMRTELVFYRICTNTVNNYISTTGSGMLYQEMGKNVLLGLIIGSSEHTDRIYELAFANLSIIVAGLIAATIICVFLEAYVIIIRPIKYNR